MYVYTYYLGFCSPTSHFLLLHLIIFPLSLSCPPPHTTNLFSNWILAATRTGRRHRDAVTPPWGKRTAVKCFVPESAISQLRDSFHQFTYCTTIKIHCEFTRKLAGWVSLGLYLLRTDPIQPSVLLAASPECSAGTVRRVPPGKITLSR